MEYTVLSPWGASRFAQKHPICPRPNTLAGKTVGLYASFKEYHPFFMRELERQLAAALPETRFSHFTYIVDTQEICDDPANLPAFAAWLETVDCVIGVGADMGSCAMYMGYNFAYIESRGVPALLLSKRDYLPAARKGAAARSYPGLRIVTYDGPGFVPNGVDCGAWTVQTYGGVIEAMLPEILRALTDPLTADEAAPAQPHDWAHETFTGTAAAIADRFYALGFTNGSPIGLPTEEAVAEMCRGTDLPRDYLVAELPPLCGQATVEKIAVNAVLAGCQPTYLPLLIAAVQGMADERIKLEGWTCSNASWEPVIVISGPIRDAIGINCGRNLFSPYTRPQSCIARAVAYIIMNLSGCRTQLEDMSGLGSPGRFGVCIAEDEANSPWPSLPADLGLADGDNAVTLFWPSEHTQLPSANVSACLGRLCTVWHGGFDVGAMVVLPPELARQFADAGYTKQAILDYMKEYNRRPTSEIPRAAIGNNHPRRGLVFPAPGLTHSAPLLWNTDHSFVLVCGRDWGAVFLGGGDHGGPVCKKAELPAAWASLCRDYPAIHPAGVTY